MKPSRNAATSPPSSELAPLGLSRCKYTVPAASAHTKSSTKMQYIARALLRRMPACASSFSVPFIQSSPPGTSAIMYRNRSSPCADFFRRVARAATTIACDCNPSKRSLNGSSSAPKSSNAVPKSKLSVAPVNRKRSRSFTIIISLSSYLDVCQLANHQNAHDLRTDRIREEFDAHRIRPQYPHIFRLQHPEPNAHHQRHPAQLADPTTH